MKNQLFKQWLCPVIGVMGLLCLVVANAQDERALTQLQQIEQIQQQNGTLAAPENQAPDLPTLNLSALPEEDVAGEQRAANQYPIDPQVQALIDMEAQDALDEAAFRSALRDAFPLTPEQILRLRERYDVTQFAEAADVGVPPRPTATSQFVNLSPGSTPPVIRLAKGFVSSLVFLDSTGAAWPITAYDLGNPEAFNIQWDKTSNTLMVQSIELYTYGNLAVRLKGLSTPVMLTLIPGQQAVDYRVDLRIQGRGPNAVQGLGGAGLPASADSILLKVLDGVPPTGSRRLQVNGGEAEAWQKGDKLYLRTRLTVLSPGWLATMSSADGMRAYELQTTPVVLVSEYGKISHLKIEGL